MSLKQYYDMIAEVDGQKPHVDPPGVTRIELEFRGGPGKEGSASIALLNGVPVYLNWYIWDLTDEYLVEQVSLAVGKKIELVNASGGNGHCQAEIKVLEEQ